MRRIDFVADPFPSSSAQLLKGLSRFGRLHAGWDIQNFSRDAANAVDRLLDTSADGVVLKAPSDEIAAIYSKLPCPAVQIHGRRVHPEVPVVHLDNPAIGRLGFEHLRDCGLRNLCFLGVDQYWSRERRSGFLAAAEGQRGVRVFDNADHPSSLGFSALTHVALVEDFLQNLPRPLGVLGANDQVAATALAAAQRLSLAIPFDLCILGVNNEESVCCSGPVAISSIDTHLELVGYKAGELLQDLLERRDPSDLAIPPGGVVVRQSSDHVAISDTLVRNAIRFIRDSRDDRGLTVDQLARHFDISRRSLERRFQKFLGRSPGEEIRRVRLERARRLLEDTHLSLTEVALEAGFFDSAHFSREFKSGVGLSPGQYRRQTLPGST